MPVNVATLKQRLESRPGENLSGAQWQCGSPTVWALASPGRGCRRSDPASTIRLRLRGWQGGWHGLFGETHGQEPSRRQRRWATAFLAGMLLPSLGGPAQATVVQHQVISTCDGEVPSGTVIGMAATSDDGGYWIATQLWCRYCLWRRTVLG